MVNKMRFGERQNMLVRLLWNIFGFAMVGAGTIGLIVPGVPGTVFFIIALFAFTEGANDVWRAKLLNHRVVGSALRHWDEHRSISLRVKWIATTCIVLSVGLSLLVTPKPIMKVIIGCLGVTGVGYVLSRRTTEFLPISDSREAEGRVA